MKITYIGTESGTSLQRARALARLGHKVHIVDPWAWLQRSKLLARFHFHSKYVLAGLLVDDRIVAEAARLSADLVWVNQGEFLGPSVVKRLRALGAPVINYANDNPFSSDQWNRFSRYRAALPYYDLVVVVFQHIVDQAIRAGARRVVRKYISADEAAHLHVGAGAEFNDKYKAEVVFVGTWMKGQRGSFIAQLIRLGVPISVWGDNWQKAEEWQIIEPHWRGPGVYDEIEYAAILRSAKICLGLLNKTSGNLHTDRSIQIPALGSLLCAQRTSEHMAMYEDGVEAVFWDDAHECAAICRSLLADDKRRNAIASRGRLRAIQNNLFNEPVLASVIDEVMG